MYLSATTTSTLLPLLSASADASFLLNTKGAIIEWTFDKNFEHDFPVARGELFLDLFKSEQKDEFKAALSKLVGPKQHIWHKSTFPGNLDLEFFWRLQKVEVEGMTHFLIMGHSLIKSGLDLRSSQSIDGLTRLPGRFECQKVMEQLIHREEDFSLIIFDIPEFKQLNKTHGSMVGDLVLQHTTSLLKSAFKAARLIAKMGPDQFGVLMLKGDIALAGSSFIESYKEPFVLEGKVLRLSLKAGAVSSPVHGVNACTLISLAEKALDCAKQNPDLSFLLYNESLDENTTKKRLLKEKLMQGISSGEFYMLYQPIVHQNGQLKGVEALMRWTDSKGAVVSPAEFIPMAEECGLINLLGAWSLREACKEMANFSKKLIVSVNVSPSQFLTSDFLKTVDEALELSGLSPSCLQLEITEGVLMTNPENSTRVLNSLAERQIKLALDDFGTGYSSLAYLKNFALNTIKIDRAFVKDLPGSVKDSAICSTVLALCEKLGMQCVAEGVETPDQWEHLNNLGCPSYQGYLFGKAAPLADIVAKYAGTPAKS